VQLASPVHDALEVMPIFAAPVVWAEARLGLRPIASRTIEAHRTALFIRCSFCITGDPPRLARGAASNPGRWARTGPRTHRTPRPVSLAGDGRLAAAGHRADTRHSGGIGRRRDAEKRRRHAPTVWSGLSPAAGGVQRSGNGGGEPARDSSDHIMRRVSSLRTQDMGVGRFFEHFFRPEPMPSIALAAAANPVFPYEWARGDHPVGRTLTFGTGEGRHAGLSSALRPSIRHHQGMSIAVEVVTVFDPSTVVAVTVAKT
jgi:hypothetical protein